MDNEGQNANTPVFYSGNIGNKATPEFFSNIKGGKKDQEKVSQKRARISKKTLLIILSIIAAALVIILMIVLIANLTGRPKGSRTNEELPSSRVDIEERAYKIVYSGDENGYENALYYLNDLIKDMNDINYDPNIIFEVYSVRALIAYEAGGENVAIGEAKRLAKEADNAEKKHSIYSTLNLIYAKAGDVEKREFYRDLAYELDVETNIQVQGGGESE